MPSLTITPLTSACVLFGCVGISYVLWKFKYCKSYDSADPFKYLNIKIVTNLEECDQVIEELKRRSNLHAAIGFDCEWVSTKRKRHPVALLQLSTFDGLCGLFRLNQMKTVPDSLKELLKDETIYKIGVEPMDDAQYLSLDYGIKLNSTLDLRHIAELCNHDPRGLGGLSKTILNIELDKNWRIRCSDWEAVELTDRQIKYAAADAHVSIKLFDKLTKEIINSNSVLGLGWSKNYIRRVNEICNPFKDRSFRNKPPKIFDNGRTNQPSSKKEIKKMNKKILGRLKPLYNNCFLVAPDNEVLCTISHKKAHWYTYKGLADRVNDDPLTVRLRFEPACRQLSEADQYYKFVKENRCVACGDYGFYLRKNVIPKEYRKHFPDIMKEHSSHDIVLLCSKCHMTSNLRDHSMRLKLASMCNAFLPNGDYNKHTENEDTRRLKSAARALLYNSEKLPEARRKELEKVVLERYPNHDSVTEDMLKEAAEAQYLAVNENFESHGVKVVDYFTKNEGLLRLEEMWREHFLYSMRPQYMPTGWSVTHNYDRLKYKFQEGRVTTDELKLTGFFNCQYVTQAQSPLRMLQSENVL